MALVTFPDGEEFACRAAKLHRDKRIFLVTETASLKQWARLEANGVTPLAPEDVAGVIEAAKGWREREPVELVAAEEVHAKALQEELQKNPVRPVLLPATAVTGLRGGCGKTSLIAALATSFTAFVPHVPVTVCTDDPVSVPDGVRLFPADTSVSVVKGSGLVLAERPFSPLLNEEFDRVLVVSRGDGVSLGRLMGLKQQRLTADRFALVFNGANKINLDDEFLPFPCVAVVSGNRNAGAAQILRYLCGDDFVFTTGRPGVFSRLLKKRGA